MSGLNSMHEPPQEPPDESKALAISIRAVGISDAVPGRISASGSVGRYVSSQGEVDYAMGILAEQIELLRTFQQAAELQLQNMSGANTENKRRDTLVRERNEAAMKIGMLTTKLLDAAKVAGDRKNEKGKVRAMSFRPGEQITVVDVPPSLDVPS